MALPAPGLSPTNIVFARCDVQAYRLGRSLHYYGSEFLRLNSSPNISPSSIRTASFNLTNVYLSVKNRTLSEGPLAVLSQTVASIVSQNAGPTDQGMMTTFIKGDFTTVNYPTNVAALNGTAGDFTNPGLFLYGNDGVIYYEGNLNAQDVISCSMLQNENVWVTSERAAITIDGAGPPARDFNMNSRFNIRLQPGAVKIKMIATSYLRFDPSLLDEARLGYVRFRKFATGTLGGQTYLPISLDSLIVAAYKQNQLLTNVPSVLVALFSAYEVVSRCY
uniref:Uncharacterized protein n=1 Tax=viral metagenome TaxID=1070528 RepID=A0A2V0RA61_9ZZZZ